MAGTYCSCSVTKSCLILCDPMNCSTPGFPVHHQLPELAQIHVHRAGDAIQPSHPAFNLSQHQGLFQWVSSLHQVTKVFGFQLQHQSFQWIFRIHWFDLLAVQGTVKSLLQHHSSKASILQCSAFFMVQLSHPYMTIGKTIALTIWTFVSKAMFLLFKTLCRFVTVILLRSKDLLISWICIDSGAQENEIWHCFHFFPTYFHWSDETPMPWSLFFECWVLSQLFHSLLSPSLRGSLVPFHFPPLKWYYLHIWGCWYPTQQSRF